MSYASAKTHPSNWYSALFVPASNERFVTTAHTRTADAIILDLEDSVAAASKALARNSLPHSIEQLKQRRLDLVVRVNRELEACLLDLNVAVAPGVTAICVPKVMGADHIRLLDEVITGLEAKQNLPPGSIGLLPLIETISGLSRAESICLSSPRVVAVAIGCEDLALDGGFDPTPENLFSPCQTIVFSAHAASIPAYGFPGSIANFSQLEVFRQQITLAKSMGFSGALCIHPKQVEIVNAVLRPTPQELSRAEELVKAFEIAEGKGLGAFEFDGGMVDRPLVERAKRLLLKPTS